MKFIHVKVFVLTLPMIAMAPDATAGQWYAGAGYGRSSISIGTVNELRSIALPDYFHSDPIVTSDDDGDDEGYKVLSGTRFGVEPGYADFGDVTVVYDLHPQQRIKTLSG